MVGKNLLMYVVISVAFSYIDLVKMNLGFFKNSFAEKYFFLPEHFEARTCMCMKIILSHKSYVHV